MQFEYWNTPITSYTINKFHYIVTSMAISQDIFQAEVCVCVGGQIRFLIE